MGCSSGYAYVCTKPNTRGISTSGAAWKDSTKRCKSEGECICVLDSDWDDDNRKPTVATPQGPKSVGQVGDLQRSRGMRSWGSPVAVYNDVQCGWGPRDEGRMKDEHPHKCPGLLAQRGGGEYRDRGRSLKNEGKSACRTTGPLWDLTTLYGGWTCQRKVCEAQVDLALVRPLALPTQPAPFASAQPE